MEWTTIESGTFFVNHQAWPLVLKSGVTPLTTDKFEVSKWRVLVTELSAP